MNIILLPHQLFPKKYVQSFEHVILWEHPQYFTKYKYNMKRLLLHRASMKLYEKSLPNVSYVDFNDEFKIPDNSFMYDPIDKIDLNPSIKLLESPAFLLSTKSLIGYKKSHKFKSFYSTFKLTNLKSYDNQNRNPPPINININNFPKLNILPTPQDIKYVNKHFANNPGTTSKFNFPISRKGALKAFKYFVKTKFNNFGKYQDSIDKDGSNLYHSIISSSMNIGLILPSECVEYILTQNKSQNRNIETFLRQLIWREYQRYRYKYTEINISKIGFNLNSKHYDGNTGVLPVDVCIKKAMNTGYLHHIERLMVVGNYLKITGIKPIEIHKWFMEFACDSYEWVMYQNVYEMVLGSDRPYIASSNYILKMSNYNKKDPWVKTLHNLYRTFICHKKINTYLPYHICKGKPISYFRPGTIIKVDNKMQTDYSYKLTAKYGDVYSDNFNPKYTPAKMLEMGVFEGKYCNDQIDEFPIEWYINSINKRSIIPNEELNYFGIKSRLSLGEWRKRGCVPRNSDDKDTRGWFEWYMRYFIGRRIPSIDEIQKQRWRAYVRHYAQVKNVPINKRIRQRQGLLQWSWSIK